MINVDKKLLFGKKKLFFVEMDETSDVTYNYYGYATKKGSVLLMRTDKDVTSSKLYIERGDFATIFAARETNPDKYKYPYELADPKS